MSDTLRCVKLVIDTTFSAVIYWAVFPVSPLFRVIAIGPSLWLFAPSSLPAAAPAKSLECKKPHRLQPGKSKGLP